MHNLNSLFNLCKIYFFLSVMAYMNIKIVYDLVQFCNDTILIYKYFSIKLSHIILEQI